jgi:hypothetical protein
MRITQGYISKSVQDFPFLSNYRLDEYNDSYAPCIFFGCYRYEDIQLINNHKGKKFVFWAGQDILDFPKNFSKIFIYDATHVAILPKVYEEIQRQFPTDKSIFVNPPTLNNVFNPQKKGNKIYAYCPKTAPEYHGIHIIEQLRFLGYDIVIGDGSFSQLEWKQGKADEFYKDVFLGLCLSDFAGGGGSIIEMGLRGIHVVTNVLKLPNCLPWTDINSIIEIIEREKYNIGSTNITVASQVFGSLDSDFKWLEL